MNPSQLDQLLKFLTDTLQQGKDFTIDQAPQFVRELLMWQFYQAAIWCAVGVFIVLLGPLVGTWMSGYWIDEEKYKYPSERRTARWLPIIGGLVLGAIIIAINTANMIQIRVAPRVVVVEMVRGLLAGQR